MISNNVHSHKSLTNEYIKDYVNLVYSKYIPFQNRLRANLYQLDIENSNYDEDLLSFYKDINNRRHGGKYVLILDFPIYLSTTTNITSQSGEKGVTTSDSTNITAIADPRLNMTVKKGDLISFQLDGVDGYYGVYRILENDASATIMDSYNRLNLALVPGVLVKNLDQFVIDVKAFLPEYHKVFKKEDASMIIKLRKLVDEFESYFNGIYNDKLDAHIEPNANRAYIDWEYTFNNLLDQYRQHFNSNTFYRSYLEYKSALKLENGIFYKLSHFDSNNQLTIEDLTIGYNNCIEGLSKIGIKTLNDRLKLYQIVCSCMIGENNAASTTLDNLAYDAYQKWDRIINDSNFINNVKEELITYLDSIKDNIKNSSMITNLVWFAQTLYIMEHIIEPINHPIREE